MGSHKPKELRNPPADMLRPGRRKEKKEVPAWKQALEESTETGGSKEHANAENTTSGAPTTVAECSGRDSGGGGGGGDGRDDDGGAHVAADDDDDDDDDDVDLSNYDLGATPQPSDDDEPPDDDADTSARGTDACKVAVANLAFEAQEPVLREFLAKCGRIESVSMPDLAHSKRTAIVTFASEASAQAAIALTGRHLPADRPGAVRRLTILLAPIGATPEEDGLKYDLLRNSVTPRAGSIQPVPSLPQGSSAEGAKRARLE